MGLSHDEPGQDIRANLLKQIRGSRVRIPDLKSLLSHWPEEIHPRVDDLDQHVRATLEWIFMDPKDDHRLRKMKASNVGLLVASWYPYASFEALCVMATFFIWLFAWDDETDSFEFSPLIQSLDSATAFRDQTMKFVRESLARHKPEGFAVANAPRLISSFESVGAAVRKSYNDDQIKRFLDELTFFIQMCEEEHSSQKIGRLPTFEEYMRRRMGSSAVGVCLALNDYTNGFTLPEDIMLDDFMKIIWHEANIIVSVMNDVVSIKKEIVQSQVDSLLPLLFLRYGSIQTALDHAVHIVSSSIGRLETAERDILNRYSTATAETQEKLRLHIKACKLACTGNLNWSLVSSRYGIHSASTGGAIYMVL
ncbi:terpenoid synthase [Xylaria grammica]|nr:terpenoid synthase [Xylaria grammica]